MDRDALSDIIAVPINLSLQVSDTQRLPAFKMRKGSTMNKKRGLLTRVQRVADVGVASHVLVYGLDPEDLGARVGQVRDTDLIAGAEESRRVVVAVLHMNHHLCKVPLHWYPLVTHLRTSEKILNC